jgi:hypothetical protein
MVESIGLCEKHELPLDRNGECELCRLSDMPSKAPPERSAWWALIIPLLILLAGALWTYASLGSDPEAPASQGVQPVAPEPAPQEPPAAEPVEAQPPERVPPRSSPPSPEEIPVPDDFAE